MFLRRAVTLLVVLVALSVTQGADAAPDERALRGAGAVSCKVYLDEWADSEAASSLMNTWAAGYLSGLNWATYMSSKQLVRDLPDEKTVTRFVDGWCAVNQKNYVFEGLNFLFEIYQKRTK